MTIFSHPYFWTAEAVEARAQVQLDELIPHNYPGLTDPDLRFLIVKLMASSYCQGAMDAADEIGEKRQRDQGENQ